MSIKRLLLSIVIALAVTPALTAKRSLPAEVPPIIVDGVRYTVLHRGRAQGLSQNGGYLEAWNAKTGRWLWRVRVYNVKYNPLQETDAQDIFIKSLSVKDDKLIVINDAETIYEVDPKTRKVRPQGRVK